MDRGLPKYPGSEVRDFFAVQRRYVRAQIDWEIDCCTIRVRREVIQPESGHVCQERQNMLLAHAVEDTLAIGAEKVVGCLLRCLPRLSTGHRNWVGVQVVRVAEIHATKFLVDGSRQK